MDSLGSEPHRRWLCRDLGLVITRMEIVYGIYGQLYNVAGVTVGAEFQINTYTTGGSQAGQSVEGLPGGGFVVTWASTGQDGNSYGIYGQCYDLAGVTVGAEFQINTYTTGSQYGPSVAGLPGGGFIVTWESDGQDGNSDSIYGQRYNATAGKVGSEFQINTYTTGAQWRPSVASLTGGGFIVTWVSDGQDGDDYGIYGQRYNATGAAVGAEFQINIYTPRCSTVALSSGPPWRWICCNLGEPWPGWEFVWHLWATL